MIFLSDPSDPIQLDVLDARKTLRKLFKYREKPIMASIKIQHGTPKGGKSLCLTCKNAKLVRGQNCEELILCAPVFGTDTDIGIVPFRVAECGSFQPVNRPSLYEMQAIAWKIEARKRGPSGFGQAPADIKPEMEVIVTPPKKNSYGSDDE